MDVRALHKQPSRRAMMREKSIRLERHGSMRSFVSADGSSIGALSNCPLTDSFSSFASRDSICPNSKDKTATTTTTSSDGPINAVSARMEQRLLELEQMKSLYSSTRGLDLAVITSGEEDEESQTLGDNSFGSLESEFDSEYDTEYEEDAEGISDSKEGGRKTASS